MEKSSSQNEAENLFFCHLCSISCSSAFNLQSHFLGIKHRKEERMEKFSRQNEPESPFYCNLCRVCCASALNLQSHFLGIRHRKAEEALRNNETEKETFEEKPSETLQEQIDTCKNSEPAVGLEYIYQYLKHDGHTVYECKLCDCRAGVSHMFMHIIGAKHRIYYLGKHHPSLGISGPFILKGPKKLKKLRDVCLKVEQEFGRQKINVVEGIPSSWSDVTGSSSEFYTPDSKLEQMDFTSDDFFKVDAKPEHVTFLELKAANEANQEKAASSTGSGHNTEEPEELEQKNTDEKSKKETHEKEEHSKESSKSDQDFTNNKDLLDFLEDFRIFEDVDAKFVNFVVEMLSIALTRYRKVCEENEENKLSDARNEQVICKKQDPVPSVVPPYANQGSDKTRLLGERKKLMFTISSNKAQESVRKCNQKQESHGWVATNVFNEDEREDTPCKYNQKHKIAASQFGNRKSRQPHPSSSRISESEFPFEIQQHHYLQRGVNNSVGNMTRGSNKTRLLGQRKKLMFTRSSNKAQESVRKCNQKQESHGWVATNVFNEDEREESEFPFEIQQHHYLQRGVNNSVGNMTRGSNKTRLLGQRKKLMFTRSSNKAQESVRKCNQKQESHGWVATNVFNEDEREESEFPFEIQQPHYLQRGVNNSVGNRTQESEFPFEMQQHHYLQRGVNNSVGNMTPALQNPVFSAPQVNRGAPFAQTRFTTPRAPFTPKAAPSLFPIANNDIMNTFFESLKNMEVGEVISTLNKITATNPAFKGIHVPSLVRYLTETGKLKSGQSTQHLNW